MATSTSDRTQKSALGRAWVVVIFTAVAATGSQIACSLVYDAGTFSASTDTVGKEELVPDPCAHAGAVPRPAVADGPDEPAKLYAARDLAMVVADKNSIGYDLDGVCTCDERPGTARGGASSCAPRRSGDRLCDADGGRDNAGAAILQNRLPDKPGASFDVGYRAAAENGASGLLFSIAEYDGRPDDPQVRVESYDSPGLDPRGSDPREPCGGAAPGSTTPPNGLAAERPQWDGCDAWRVGASFQQGGVARTGTREAWVAGGKLFARFPTLRLRVDRTYVTFVDVHMEAALVRGADGAPDRLTRGVIAGATRAEELLVAFGELRTGPDGGPLCTTPAFPGLVEDTCANLDLALRAPEADTGTIAPCDAASIVLTFEATLARRGSNAPDGVVGASCAEAGVVPSCR